MGYKRKDLQILGGGFNMLPPGDKVPKTDYLQACNWRVDRLGNLVSRFGYPQKFAITAAALAHSAFINGGVNGDYYVGCNASVTAPSGTAFVTNPSKLYWNFGGTAIATGFDGNRIGLACMNAWVYFMNRGKQGRHQASLGSASQTWNLAQPANSPTPVAASGPGTSSSVTYVYTLQGNPAYIHYLNIAGNIYQFAENGYSAAQLPLVIASLASADPNCTVSYDGTPADGVVITPIVQNTLVQVSGSDGNTATNLADGSVTSLPNGTYRFYATYGSTDETLESNPSAVSDPVALSNQSVTLSDLVVSPDARVGIRNIYAIGGTLAQPYQVTTIGDNTSTSWTFSFSDLQATNAGIVMSIDHDAPPAAAGMVGPHFSRLFAWSTLANPNRLFYTDPDLPQYWPGSADPAEGNWVDVGAEGEAILWCTVHGNLLVIYKERSIWMLVGDPDTGYLQQKTDTIGLGGAFAVTAAGEIDYFAGPGGLYVFDMDRALPFGGEIRPLFQAGITGGPLLAPGSILQGTAFNSGTAVPAMGAFAYALALGYGMGKLYVSYAETTSVGTSYCLLVYQEESKRWFYHRNSVAGTTAFYGFVFDGMMMVGLTGVAAAAAIGLNLDDFRFAPVTDAGSVAMTCVYQSHYEDCGLPDNQKRWLEVVIDYEFAGGDTATVYVGFDGGVNLNPAGYAGGTTYSESQWVLSGGVAYQSLRGGNVGNTPASSPTWWLPVPASPGTLSGNGRRQTSFYLGYVASLVSADGVLAKNISVVVSGAASHLMILHNVYLYYYEEARLALAASTIPTDLGVGKVKQCKELELDIDASNGNVGIAVYSDLPGNVLTAKQALTVTANSGRALMKYPFSVTAGPPPSYSEGYLWRLALTAAAGPFRLYAARLLMRAIGVYVEAYEAAGGFVWDSMETTFSSAITKIPRTYAIALAATPIKRARQIRLQIETFNANVTLKLLSDLPGDAQAVVATATVNTGTAGRRFWPVMLPNGVSAPWIEGRLFRLQLSGVAKFILYEAVMEIQPYGVFLEAIETAGGAVWDSLEMDLGTEMVKQIRELELDLWAYGAYTVTVYSDLPGNVMALRGTYNQLATSSRRPVRIPLPQGTVPDNYLYGRLLRVVIQSAAAFKLFGGRIHARPIGLYIETYEAAAGAMWDSMAQDLGNPNDKYFDQVRFEMDTDGVASVQVFTDLPGEIMAQRGTALALTSGATARHWATAPLATGVAPFIVEGRSIRLLVLSAAGFRLYRAQVRSCRIGRYLAAVTPSAAKDSFNTLEFDFNSGKIKLHKRIEIDLAADGPLTITVYTEQGGQLAQMWTTTITTPGRMVLTMPLPPGIRGRLLRIALSSAQAARVFRLRSWSREVNEPKAVWAWDEYPLENSDALPEWADIKIPETPAEFVWAPLPVSPTPPAGGQPGEEWIWAKFLQVEDTPDEWQWVDVDVQVGP